MCCFAAYRLCWSNFHGALLLSLPHPSAAALGVRYSNIFGLLPACFLLLRLGAVHNMGNAKRVQYTPVLLY